MRGCWAVREWSGVGVEVPQDGSSHTHHQEDLDVFHATFAAPDLTTFCNLDELGLRVVGQHVDAQRATLECRVVDADDVCRWCGGRGRSLGTIARRLAHEPFSSRPTTCLLREPTSDRAQRAPL